GVDPFLAEVALLSRDVAARRGGDLYVRDPDARGYLRDGLCNRGCGLAAPARRGRRGGLGRRAGREREQGRAEQADGNAAGKSQRTAALGAATRARKRLMEPAAARSGVHDPSPPSDCSARAVGRRSAAAAVRPLPGAPVIAAGGWNRRLVGVVVYFDLNRYTASQSSAST